MAFEALHPATVDIAMSKADEAQPAMASGNFTGAVVERDAAVS